MSEALRTPDETFSRCNAAAPCTGRAGKPERLAGRARSLPRTSRASRAIVAGGPRLVLHRTLWDGGAPLRLDRTACAETWCALTCKRMHLGVARHISTRVPSEYCWRE